LCTIWHIPEGFATLVAGVFVIVAAAIAWWSVQGQIRATREIEATKVRLDLYNRRYQIFDSIFDFYNALIGWTGTPEQRTAQTRFFRASQEAVFLFKPESGIAETLKSCMRNPIRGRGPPARPYPVARRRAVPTRLSL
jgi:hypothetical protein